MSANEPTKPALATAGFAGGGSLSLMLIGAIVQQALSGAPAAHGDELRLWLINLGVKCALAVAFGVWAFVTALKPGVLTGLRTFDAPKAGSN